MNFSLGCSLVYRVKSSTPFVFNFEAARFDAQTVQEERLQMIPKTTTPTSKPRLGSCGPTSGATCKPCPRAGSAMRRHGCR
jgi:hypothetical protein